VVDLYNVPENGKAELVNGELKRMCPTGGKPGRAGMKICSSLQRYEELNGGGYAIPDNVGFLVALPNRESFSPDTAWYIGPSPDMDFLEGSPTFAVEIRSKNDYGHAAERSILSKIADYFAAGTLVVWDVDLVGAETVRVYRADNPDDYTSYSRSDTAEAEPALPGWRFPVSLLFD
jgi:Uma2 family endonuclease